MESLLQLTRFDDRLSYLYLEKGHIEQNDKSVAYVNENQFVPIPAADLALLMLGPGTSIEAIRGKEGYRVRAAYQRAALEFGVQWKGRNYDAQDWDGGDPLNRGLSAASACLNGLVQAGIVSAGYSAAVGFIHTGKMLSFVYDVADLYKIDLLVPLVFKVVSVSVGDVERRVRKACRVELHERKLLDRILPDIREVLDGSHDSGGRSAQSAGRSESLDARTEGRNIPRPHDGTHP